MLLFQWNLQLSESIHQLMAVRRLIHINVRHYIFNHYNGHSYFIYNNFCLIHIKLWKLGYILKNRPEHYFLPKSLGLQTLASFEYIIFYIHKMYQTWMCTMPKHWVLKMRSFLFFIYLIIIRYWSFANTEGVCEALPIVQY